MISMWTLYLLNVAFSISHFLVLPIIASACLVLLGVIGKIVDDNIGKIFNSYMKPAMITLVICVLFAVLIPTKKEALAIYMIPKIINNQQMQELPDNALKYLNVFFKKEISEITKGTEDK